jgi:hypothetical protein
MSFTDEELLAYVDECLPVKRSAEVEATLRQSEPLRLRLSQLLAEQDQGGRTVGEIWRRGRVSCPGRSLWTSYLDGQVGEGLRRYLEFHLETVGCRFCAANLNDLRSSDDAASQVRRQKIFQTSIGRLKVQ